MNQPIISVDKFNLVCTLPESSLKDVLERLTWRNGREDEMFHKIHVNKKSEPYYRVFLRPKLTYAYRYYNIMICASNKTFQSMPESLQYLLSLGNWKIKQIDIAFDFIEPITNSFYLKPRNANTKTYEDNNNEYICAKSNRAGALVYDKKKQAKDKLNIQLPYSNLTRFELRLKPKLNDLNIFNSSMNFSWLQPLFDKFLFIPNIGNVPLSKEQKKYVDAYNKDKKWNSHIPRRQKDKLLKLLKSNCINLYTLFDSNKTTLFAFNKKAS